MTLLRNNGKSVPALQKTCDDTTCAGPCMACNPQTDMCEPANYGNDCAMDGGLAGHCSEGICTVSLPCLHARAAAYYLCRCEWLDRLAVCYMLLFGRLKARPTHAPFLATCPTRCRRPAMPTAAPAPAWRVMPPLILASRQPPTRRASLPMAWLAIVLPAAARWVRLAFNTPGELGFAAAWMKQSKQPCLAPLRDAKNTPDQRPVSPHVPLQPMCTIDNCPGPCSACNTLTDTCDPTAESTQCINEYGRVGHCSSGMCLVGGAMASH